MAWNQSASQVNNQSWPKRAAKSVHEQDWKLARNSDCLPAAVLTTNHHSADRYRIGKPTHIVIAQTSCQMQHQAKAVSGVVVALREAGSTPTACPDVP
jgi:hypothetical protein